MGLKSVFIVLVILIAVVGAPLMVEAQLGNIISLCLINIQGTVFCTANGNMGTNGTANGNMGTNGTATPIFPNAVVQLQCGDQNIVSTATTNNMGIFSIFMNPLQFIVSSLLSNCDVAVKTPLSNCNVTLPSIGSLVSPLAFAGNTLQGLLNIINIIPREFQFIV